MSGVNPFAPPEDWPEPRCKNHPERVPVDPIALRWCAECKSDAEARYADDTRRSYFVERQTDSGQTITETWKE